VAKVVEVQILDPQRVFGARKDRCDRIHLDRECPRLRGQLLGPQPSMLIVMPETPLSRRLRTNVVW
jgi:hypothetical protein